MNDSSTRDENKYLLSGSSYSPTNADPSNIQENQNTESSVVLKPDTAPDTNCDETGNNEAKKEEETFSFRQLPRRSKTMLILLSLANVFAGCGFSLLAPFFPQEAQKKDVSDTVTGLIFSSFEFVIFLSSPIFGNYLTRVGPKFMFFSGIFVGGICAILFGTLDRCPPGISFIIICFACRVVEALGLSAFITASFAIITNEFPQHVATVFGMMETASGIGLMVGPALGGGLYELGGFGLPFYVIGVLILLNGGMIYVFLPEIHNGNEERKGSFFSLFKSLTVWIAMLSIVAGAIGITYLDPTLSKHLKQFHLTTPEIGLVFVIAPGLYAFTAPLWGYISDKKGIQAPLIVMGNLMCGISFLLVGPCPWLSFLPLELWVIIIGGVLLGLFIGCAVVPTMKCLVNSAIDIGFEDNLDTYGIVSGLFNSAFCFGAFLGPTVGGVLQEKLGFRFGATVVGGIYFIAMFCSGIYFLIFYLQRRSRGGGGGASVQYEKICGIDDPSSGSPAMESVTVTPPESPQRSQSIDKERRHSQSMCVRSLSPPPS